MAEPYEDGGGLRRFREELVAWLDEHDGSLVCGSPGAPLDEEVARTRANQRLLWDAGWLRHGWPESVGGRGGSQLLRAVTEEAGAERGLFYGPPLSMTEVLGPTVIAASPQLAEVHITPFLRGEEGWCQGFSEPEAGSDLASLRCRAVDGGDHWRITGQKIWTSYAQFATKIVLLARTGATTDRHRGITAMLVDMSWPGVTVRPLHAINDMDEFSEIFFDDVRVPKERVIGEVNGGWQIALGMLRCERGGVYWMFSRWLLEELTKLSVAGDLDGADDDAVGSALLSIASLRARVWSTQHRMAADCIDTPETSVDKILMATAEQELFDVARDCQGGALEFADDAATADLRSAYMYSRAASIYGGTAEIQRNIVADQLLGLPRATG